MPRNHETIRLILILSISVFVIEIAIMAALKFFDFPHTSLEGLADAAVLTIILFPVLYFLVFKKLVLQNDTLISVESQLLAAKDKFWQA